MGLALKELIMFGNIKLNPGLKKDKPCDKFSQCHWNLNSIAAHDFSTLSLLEAYNTHLMYDIICLSEIYLDSSVPYNDPRFKLSGYKLVRADKLSNNKKVLSVFISKKPLQFDQHLLTT